MMSPPYGKPIMSPWRYFLAGLMGLWLLLTPWTTAIQAQAQATAEVRVGYLHIEGMINRPRFMYLKRALEDAEQRQLDTLIVHIDTDGGELQYGREMLKLILDQPREGRETIAFVDYRAISAGAMIAYGHQQIYISDTATIGDIGVIFAGPGGIEYAPEKIETLVRALLAQAAEQNAWSRGLILKMTARNQNLYRVTRPDGSHEFVIADDLPEFLARYPEIDRDDPQQVLVYRGEDRLLTLTGREAVDLGMATALTPTLEALYAELGLEADEIVHLVPSTGERVADVLSRWAPILGGLMLLFLFFELQTPGVGLWAALGLTAGAAFLVAQYTLEMIAYLELILLGAGIVLLVIELLTAFSGGLLGIAGGVLILAGLFLSFLPNELEFDFSDEYVRDVLTAATFNSLGAAVVMAVGLLVFFAGFNKNPLTRRLVVRSEIKSDSGGDLDHGFAALVGQQGISRSALHPGGRVWLAGRDYSARALHGDYIPAQRPVKVVGVEFGELIVVEYTDSESLQP
jgi:membrane-bound serine protease (ClpP class)